MRMRKANKSGCGQNFRVHALSLATPPCKISGSAPDVPPIYYLSILASDKLQAFNLLVTSFEFPGTVCKQLVNIVTVSSLCTGHQCHECTHHKSHSMAATQSPIPINQTLEISS